VSPKWGGPCKGDSFRVLVIQTLKDLRGEPVCVERAGSG